MNRTDAIALTDTRWAPRPLASGEYIMYLFWVLPTSP